MKHRDLQREQGSLAVVLLAAIILGGAVAALFVTVNTGVDTARRDRDWHGAINAADAGIQEAVTVIRSDEVATACPGGVCTGTLSDGGSYVATYTETFLGYQVCSEGQLNDVDREACADFDLNLLFGGAGVIGIDRVRIDGTAAGVTDPIIIGTAGEFVNVTNACDKLEELEFYNDSDVAAPNPCPDVTVNSGPRTFVNLAEEAFLTGECSGDALIWPSYPSQPHPADARDPWIRGETYCTSLVDIPQNDNIQLTGTSDEPVKVFVDPGDTGSAAAKYPGRGQVNTLGDALDLQFFIRQGEVDLDMKGNTSINALWYAPDSACDVRGNTTFTGAVLCRSVDLGGAFDFIVPDDLRFLRAGPTVMDRWYEP